MTGPRLRPGHLAHPRPVPARRAQPGDVRLVFVRDQGAPTLLVVVAGILGAVTTVASVVGMAVIA